MAHAFQHQLWLLYMRASNFVTTHMRNLFLAVKGVLQLDTKYKSRGVTLDALLCMENWRGYVVDFVPATVT